MSKGVVAVLGPSASPASNSIISNICGEKEVSVCTQLAFSQWPILGSMFTVQLELQSLEQWRSLAAVFLGFFFEGHEILVIENDEIPQQWHNSPFQSYSNQSTAGHFISSSPLISLEQFGLPRLARYCFEVFYIETNTKSTDIDQTSPSCCLKSGVWN